MNDAGIIDLYWQRSGRAIPETENAYGPYCHTVAYNLLRNAEDAEESVNDTWLAAWNAMPPERPNSLKAFLGRITRNISVTRLRRSGSQKRGGGEAGLAIDELSECLPGGERSGADGGKPRASPEHRCVPLIASRTGAGHFPRTVLLRADRGGDRRAARHEDRRGENLAVPDAETPSAKAGRGGILNERRRYSV